MEKREIGNKESACFVAANFCVALQKAPASQAGSLIVKSDCHLCENIRNELKQSPQEKTRTRDLCRDRGFCQPYRTGEYFPLCRRFILGGAPENAGSIARLPP